ncbi:AAA family ATPase [Epidermidibacterium keratini]|uniref:AAA family ATPase n=1 Tax=Epidermidibacterium keratini TaxID=1891644 RepID=A0A7L4YL63_9ACTN|nr:AAA family ATPase [Epidermidibacterium keratini]QHB99296.1 AAA family ATPase [Epidermidibacterium keratini]
MQHNAAAGPAADFVLVAGVPGAGKSTALRALVGRVPNARILDPEQPRDWVRARFADLPYRRYRPLVHLIATLRVLWFVLRGPGKRPLVVHEPGTRTRLRRALVRLAHARGWRPALVFIEVTPAEAARGQHARGRILREQSFAGHWKRWSRLKEHLTDGLADEPWEHILVVPRSRAVDAIAGELTATGTKS